MCKKNLRLLSFFVFFCCLPAQSQTFGTADLERLIKQHPMMKNYDPETGRFNNTPSQVVSPVKINSQIASAQAEIATFENLRKKQLNQALGEKGSVDEKLVWQRLTELSESIKQRKRLLLDLEELRATGGVPAISRVLPIARNIILEVREQLPSSDIVLNKLPRFYRSFPEFVGNPLQEFFFDSKRTDDLLAYIRQVSCLSLLFPRVKEPILIDERKK